MRYAIIVLSMTFGLATSALAQSSIGIGLPGVSIGINVPLFPELVRVPGYPVYYAPRLQSNFFFYDGMYWVYQGDNWYASSWYNGPWGLVAPEDVPVFVLRIPVRYYRSPPAYFRGWQADASPRWGEHWGNAWQEHRSGWDQWNRRSAPPPAPLPTYQRRYSADRYPQAQQQQVLRSQNYHYEPRDAMVRQRFQQQAPQKSPAPPPREPQTAAPAQRPKPSQPGGEPVRRPEPIQAAPQPKAPAVHDQRKQPQPVVPSREQQRPASSQTAPQPRAPAVQDQRKQPQPAVPSREQQHPASRQTAPQPRAPAVQDQRKQPQPVVLSREKQRPAPTGVAPQARGPAAQDQRKQAPLAAPREQPLPVSKQKEATPAKRAPPQQQQPVQRQGKGRESSDEPGQERTK
jgi:hypothetical protein